MPAPVDPANFAPHTLTSANAVDARFPPLYKALDSSQAGGGLDSAMIVNASVTMSLLAPIEAWQSVALSGDDATWSPNTLEFYKDPLGVVQLRPKVYTVTGTLNGGERFARLPAGYRPLPALTLETPPLFAHALYWFTPIGTPLRIEPGGDMKMQEDTTAPPPFVLMIPSFKAEG